MTRWNGTAIEQHKSGGYETRLGTNRLEIETAPKIG
jgi:hypothetical protein